MKHILYKTTNLLNQRYYIGIHSTDNVDDGYLGSGKRIRAEIEKYGRDNFERAVLEELPSRNLLLAREREVVNEMLLTDPFCLNLKKGGEGGGRKWSDEHQRIRSIAGGKAATEIFQSILKEKRKDPEWVKRWKENMSIAKRGNTAFKGKKHSEETKQKMRKSKNVGEANSQFGTCWVTDGVKSVKIKKEQLDVFMERGFRRGRK